MTLRVGLTHPALTKLTFMDYLLTMLRNRLRRKLSYDRRVPQPEAAGPVRLSLQIQHSQTSARSHMVHARTQTPVRFPGQISVGAQAPSSQEAAAAAKHQQQLRQQLEERAQERGARDAVVPLLARAVASAEAAQRAASQQLEAVRPTAERSAREAAAAAADREAAVEHRGASLLRCSRSSGLSKK